MREPKVQDEPIEEMFTIDSDRAAEWLLRKLANIEAERARVQAQAAAIVRQLESDAEGLRFSYVAQLEAYCRRKIEHAGGWRKSVHFLQGSCTFRTVSESVRVADVGVAQERLPDAVQTVQTLDERAYAERAQKEMEETGALLLGIERLSAREAFCVKFGKLE